MLFVFAVCGNDGLPPKPSVVMPSALSATLEAICTRAAGSARNGEERRLSTEPYARASLITALPKCEVSAAISPPP